MQIPSVLSKNSRFERSNDVSKRLRFLDLHGEYLKIPCWVSKTSGKTKHGSSIGLGTEVL